MNARQKQLRRIIERPSILVQAIGALNELELATKSSVIQAAISSRLKKVATEEAICRASFIETCQAAIFDENREKWGIPVFAEDLVNSDDFKNGFLWRFRAHTTSWSDNQYADQWFYTSAEAASVTRYEFWSCDDGPNKLELCIEGSYKDILKQLLQEQVFEVLISPAFSTSDLLEFIDSYSEEENDYPLEDLLEDYISQNPNYLPA